MVEEKKEGRWQPLHKKFINNLFLRKEMLERVGLICGALAFAFCLAGGIYILVNVGFETGGDAVWTGLGLYFIGKALFVGPMLIITILLNRR